MAFTFPRRTTERLDDLLASEGFPTELPEAEVLRDFAVEVHAGMREILASKVQRRLDADTRRRTLA